MPGGFQGTGGSAGAGELLGQISDPFGETETEVILEPMGIILGRSYLSVVNDANALFHIVETKSAAVEGKVDALASQLDGDPMFGEDEII